LVTFKKYKSAENTYFTITEAPISLKLSNVARKGEKEAFLALNFDFWS
jgi:hypothetical protein